MPRGAGERGHIVLKIAEVAIAARCSTAAVAAAIRRGELACVRIGSGTRRRHQRVPVGEAARWLGCSSAELLARISHGEHPGISSRTAQIPGPHTKIET